MILPVQVSFRNTPHSDKIEAMVCEEAAHLDSYYNHIMACRVMIRRRTGIESEPKAMTAFGANPHRRSG